jgi:hypothetical protein
MADIKAKPVCLKFYLRQGKITTGINKTLELACRVETMGKIQIIGFPHSKFQLHQLPMLNKQNVHP